MKVIHYISCLVTLLLSGFCFSSCEEEFNPDLGDSDANILSISGNLHSGGLSTIYVNWVVKDEIDLYNYIDLKHPVMTLIGSDGSEVRADYYGGDRFFFYSLDLSSSNYYVLQLSTYAFVVETDPMRPCVTPKIADLTYRQWPDTHIIDILTSCESTGDEKLYLKYTYEEDWEVKTRFDCLWSYNLSTQSFERKLYHTDRGWIHEDKNDILIANSKDYASNVIGNYTVKSFAHTDTRAYRRYRIRMTQRALSQGEYDYCVARAKCSSDVGGLFSPMPVEYPTNLKVVEDYGHKAPGLVGYVGAAVNVETEEIYINSDSIYYKDIIEGEYLRNDDSTFVDLDYYISNGWLLCEVRNKDMFGVASPQFVDCLYWGASIYPPNDWIFDIPYKNWSWILYNEPVPLYDFLNN